MKLELNFALDIIRESNGNYYAGAIGMIRSIINADYSPFTKVRNVRTVLAALDTVLAEAGR
ncbi:hypothetical protein NST07_25775 [Paenibacillus sp. FSL L8-0340]|uniref:hypothetical protein n=1 Tax=Paenibacillus sp. FSL L8-0340 TaxID=2954685 RepID=UPI00315898F9